MWWVSRDLRSVVEVVKLGLNLGIEKGWHCKLKRPYCGRLHGRTGARGRWLCCLVGRRSAFGKVETARLGGWAVLGRWSIDEVSEVELERLGSERALEQKRNRPA